VKESHVTSELIYFRYVGLS